MPYVGNKSTTFNTFSATDVSVTDDLTVTDDATVGGNLGIGNTSPSQRLDVQESTVNKGMLVYNTNTTSGASVPVFLASESDGSTTNVSIENASAGTLMLRTGATAKGSYGTSRMQIDASGNVVFNEDSVDADFRIESNGNANAFFVNGGTNNIGIGTDSPVGSLHIKDVTDTAGSDVYMLVQNTTNNRVAGYQIDDESGTLSLEMKYDNGGNTATIRNPNNGVLSVYLGGTGSSNQLDDYEEGTWTPRLGASTAGVATPGSNNNGYYTKVGRVVHVTGFLVWSEITTSMSGDLQLQGLPFTVANLTGNSPSQPITRMFNGFTNGSSIPHAFHAAPNTTVAAVIGFSGQGGSGQNWTGSVTASASGNIYDINLTYITSD